MAGTGGANGTTRKASKSDASPGSRQIDEERERRLAHRRQWVAANRERIRESNRQWRLNNLERARQLNRESMARAAERQRRERAQRRKAAERSRRWKEAHPERVREKHRRWVEVNRDKVRAYNRDYHRRHQDASRQRTTAWRDEHPERMAELRKEWAERNKDKRAEYQRKRREDPAKRQADLEANAAARRLRRKLVREGLPPRRLHPTSAAERRANDRAASAFFEDPQAARRLRQSAASAEALLDYVRKHRVKLRADTRAALQRREQAGLPPIDAEQHFYARAVEAVLRRRIRTDLLTGRDVAAAVRTTRAVVRREERQAELEKLVQSVVTYIHRNATRLIADAELENRFRRRNGKPPAGLEALVVGMAVAEVHPEAAAVLPDGELRAVERRVRARVHLARNEGAQLGPPAWSFRVLH
ncbi:hypothetical protein [Agromyces seonyuensis]|uniref:Uncharacterized protein n=1 Tax=Agromyces seonyuensis TaxID=2662446 RepID=A0A6I4NYI3_9MICO|nr:hypothetical protein [Agromyces seonyuensis]MWB99430.1 hypothetical protein [Agromyces seonyuensis]